MKKQDPSSVYIITPCSLQRSREYPASEQFVFDANVNINQVQKIIKSLATNKSAGIDKIPIRVIKDCLPAILPSITSIINATFLSAQFPNVWKIAEVTPILKDGDVTFLTITGLFHCYLCSQRFVRELPTIS